VVVHGGMIAAWFRLCWVCLPPGGAVSYEVWIPHVAIWIAAMCRDMTVMSVGTYVYMMMMGRSLR